MNPITDVNPIEQMLVERASRMRLPIACTLELTPLCNFDCRMCYVRLSGEALRERGRLLSGSEWLRIAEEMKTAGVLFVLLTGGEPLLHPDFREIYRGLISMEMIVSVNTNGSLIDEEWADFFAENRPRRVNITLYGANEETYENLCRAKGQFDKVLRGIKLLKERGVAVKMSGMLCPTETAAFIWKILPEADDEEAVVQALMDEYEVDEETVRRDVKAFFEMAGKYELVLK